MFRQGKVLLVQVGNVWWSFGSFCLHSSSKYTAASVLITHAVIDVIVCSSDLLAMPVAEYVQQLIV